MGALSGLAFLLVVAFFVPSGARAADGDATAFMNDLGGRVVALVRDAQRPEAERRAEFQKIADGAFDIPKIAQFVLGRYWRGASDADKTGFTKAFENYMISVYWSRFAGYNGESFKVIAQKDEGNGTILVTTDIFPANGNPIKVSWSVIKQGDSFRIRDASLEGVSQAITYRDEFGSYMERNGGKISALIANLTERAKG
jgi:phospholipid transport system substrate-binding protein